MFKSYKKANGRELAIVNLDQVVQVKNKNGNTLLLMADGSEIELEMDYGYFVDNELDVD